KHLKNFFFYVFVFFFFFIIYLFYEWGVSDNKTKGWLECFWWFFLWGIEAGVPLQTPKKRPGPGPIKKNRRYSSSFFNAHRLRMFGGG
ncbi:hypothetical protein, partial [Enterobacter hormaechei]